MNYKNKTHILCLTILLPTIVLIVYLGVSVYNLSTPVNPEYYSYVYYFYMILSIVSGLAIYIDQKYVNENSEWDASGIYYLSALPVMVNVLLGSLYVYKRLRKTPSQT